MNQELKVHVLYCSKKGGGEVGFRSGIRGHIWENIELIQAIVVVTCKDEKDPIKNSQEKVATLFFPV